MTGFDYSCLPYIKLQYTFFSITWLLYTLTNSSDSRVDVSYIAVAVTCSCGFLDVHDCLGQYSLKWLHSSGQAYELLYINKEWLMNLAMYLAILYDTYVCVATNGVD